MSSNSLSSVNNNQNIQNNSNISKDNLFLANFYPNYDYIPLSN
jgi:hypothetical protein